jgi:hypothetical protein
MVRRDTLFLRVVLIAKKRLPPFTIAENFHSHGKSTRTSPFSILNRNVVETAESNEPKKSFKSRRMSHYMAMSLSRFGVLLFVRIAYPPGLVYDPIRIQICVYKVNLVIDKVLEL